MRGVSRSILSLIGVQVDCQQCVCMHVCVQVFVKGVLGAFKCVLGAHGRVAGMTRLLLEPLGGRAARAVGEGRLGGTGGKGDRVGGTVGKGGRVSSTCVRGGRVGSTGGRGGRLGGTSSRGGWVGSKGGTGGRVGGTDGRGWGEGGKT